MKNKRRCPSCLPFVIVALVISILILILVGAALPELAGQTFGSPSSELNNWQRYNYSFRLLWSSGDLLTPGNPDLPEQIFVINPGESIASISQRLQDAGLITNAEVFRTYLIWKGMDRSVQSGTYRLNPGFSGTQVAEALQTPSPSDATLAVLSGWRKEEIAAALTTSGLNISSVDFLLAVNSPEYPFEYIPAGGNVEGFLSPGLYVLPRSTTAQQLISVLLSSFTVNLSADLRDGFSRNGLDVYQAVILASIIEREAIIDDEMPMIASVFYNRLGINMKLESDPTVQYALGYNDLQATWWTNPLSAVDLQVNSPFNTYVFYGLPPAPISNPGLSALQAVAYPAQTPYYFFMARCDGSGYHNFSENYEEHKMNICP